MRNKLNKGSPTLTLAKGQLWKINDLHIQITELGKLLVHYKMLRELGQMRRTQMTRIDSMQRYLKAHRATIVKAPLAG